MKLAISYFAQIRNFKKTMLPISTAISDPRWFHDDRDDSHIYVDKRGIVNGIRCLPIIECGNAAHNCHGPENCSEVAPACQFLKTYRENLYKNINYTQLINDFKDLENWYKKEYNINEEIIIVLIVYETPDNPCSERSVLIDYFNKHGMECKELDYPIQKLELIKDDLFDF